MGVFSKVAEVLKKKCFYDEFKNEWNRRNVVELM